MIVSPIHKEWRMDKHNMQKRMRITLDIDLDSEEELYYLEKLLYEVGKYAHPYYPSYEPKPILSEKLNEWKKNEDFKKSYGPYPNPMFEKEYQLKPLDMPKPPELMGGSKFPEINPPNLSGLSKIPDYMHLVNSITDSITNPPKTDANSSNRSL